MDIMTQVLLLTDDSETEGMVCSALEREHNLTEVRVCPDIVSLTIQLERTSIPIVLVDIDRQSKQLLERLEPIIDRFVQRRFVVLSSDLSNDLVLQAMQAGARYVQHKKTIKSDLAGVLVRLMPNGSAQAGRAGIVLTVLSASGGCGGTTLAVNLANELQIDKNESVLLVDMDYHYGAVATYLELGGQFGIADVLAHNGCIDPQLIHTTTVRHSENLDVLLSPASIDFSRTESLEKTNLDVMLSACKQSHAYTVIDAPRVSMDVAETLAAASDQTLIVLQPMVKDLRVTKATMDALMDRGIAADRIVPVVNRYRKRGQMVSFEDAQEVLDGVSLRRLRNDYTSAIRSINYGKPLSQSAPRSPLRRDLVQLAQFMAEVSATSNGNGNGKGS